MADWVRVCCYMIQGDFPETHENFIGTYWGLVSTPCAAEIVESASNYIIVGPLFNDYNTVAFTLLLDESESFPAPPQWRTCMACSLQ